MTLTPEQRQAVINQLQDAYDPDSFQRMLLLRLGKRLHDWANVGQPFPDVLMEVVDKAEMGGWLRALLEAAMRFLPERGELTAFVIKLTDELAPAELLGADPDPFRACFLRKGHRFPFINRDTVRAVVQEMYDPLGERRVLIVDGSTRVGKSYTNEYFTFLSSQYRSHKYYYVDLADDYVPEYRSCDLMLSIARRMGVDPNTVPKQEAQAARWSRLLVDWLIGEATRAKQTWWIVLDGLCKVHLREDMEELVKNLVKVIARTNPPVRLALLDCGGPERVPLDALDSVAAIRIERVGKPDLVAFFAERATAMSESLTTEALDTTAQWVLDEVAGAGPEPEEYMARLSAAVVTAHQRIYSPTEVTP